MDLLLTLAERFVLTWVWTDEVLDEWERAIVETKHRTPESAKSISDAVRVHFGSVYSPVRSPKLRAWAQAGMS